MSLEPTLEAHHHTASGQRGSLDLFNDLSLRAWRQFAAVEIRFHERLTLLTGANGAGKTTVLNVLNRHFGWSIPLIATPRLARGEGTLTYSADYRPLRATGIQGSEVAVGSITYSDGMSSPLNLPANPAHEYQLSIPGLMTQRGIFVASHRPIYFYQRVERIPTQLTSPRQMGQPYLSEVRDLYRGARPASPSFRIKETLLAWAAFGYSNRRLEANRTAGELFDGFERVLGQVLPASIGFRRLLVRPPEIALDTATGEFSFDAVSGGAAALIDMAWQLFTASQDQGPALSVVIDEPENHLHPELQRIVLPRLMEAFPHAQFIAATHSPLVISSVPSASVYVLRFDNHHRVRSEPLDMVDRSGDADRILREVLGLESTLPDWTQQRLVAIARRLEEADLNAETVAAVRLELEALGMSYLVPEIVGERA